MSMSSFYRHGIIGWRHASLPKGRGIPDNGQPCQMCGGSDKVIEGIGGG